MWRHSVGVVTLSTFPASNRMVRTPQPGTASVLEINTVTQFSKFAITPSVYCAHRRHSGHVQVTTCDARHEHGSQSVQDTGNQLVVGGRVAQFLAAAEPPRVYSSTGVSSTRCLSADTHVHKGGSTIASKGSRLPTASDKSSQTK
jgi:hypothetical protein